jgi:hypothetical protein
MRLKERDCDPGIPGCILHGRFVFSTPEKNKPAARTKRSAEAPAPPSAARRRTD